MKRKLPKEPSKTGMILTAVSGVTLGVLIGSFLLLRQAPLRGNQSSSAHRIGVYAAHYTPGAVASAESATLKSRISRLGRQIPGSIPFTEMEINHYLSQFKSTETTEGGEAANVTITSPNVRIESDHFVLSTKMVFNPKKERFEVLVQAIGHFENNESGVNMKIDRLLLNSLPVPKIGGLVNGLFQSKASMFPLPTEVRSALGAIRQVELLEDQIVLVL